ncbi:MAG TPA: tetratricopeptide repeat protein [Gemmatimonadales bacterium]|jgi:tetratricopeptide (TPR) repeat protein
MNFEKLKDTARKYEQKEEWRRAIEVYLQAIREFEAGNDPVPDLSVYNRIGDLYLKANEPGAAVQAYERAADLYGEQGFYNNAIALCGKILRVNPGRIQTYLKLAHLHARKNVVIEAKKNLLEYLERMNALNQLDDAFKSVKEFADQFPGNKEIRLMLSELLRASSRNDEAREQLEKLASDLEARGDTVGARKTLQRLQALDAEAPTQSEASKAPPLKPRTADLVFLDTGAPLRAGAKPPVDTRPSRKTRAITTPSSRDARPTVPASDLPLIEIPDAEPPTESPPLTIETSSLVEGSLELESVQPISDEASLEATASGDVAKTLGFEPTVVESGSDLQVAPLEGLELDQPLPDNVELTASTAGIELERSTDVGDHAIEPLFAEGLLTVDPLGAEGLDTPLDEDLGHPNLGLGSTDLELIETEEPEPTAGEPPGFGEPVTFLDMDAPPTPSVSDLEDRVLEDPDDPETHRALGEALLAAGEQLRGQEELELALAGYEGREDWQHASDLLDELIRLDPNGVRYHQKRVEVGFRSGDRARLIEAYLELADALLRVGALDKALSVYRRVSEHDPGNQRALAALDALSHVEETLPPIPPAPAPPPPGVADEVAQAVDAMLEPAPGAPSDRKARQSVPVGRPKLQDQSGDFVDLGALILDEDRVKDTRMRVEDEEPTGDEQQDFQEMLQQFKRGIDANIDAEDFQAHYDLGVAFKEMGLLDEAIAEFQKALRSPEGRLKTSEALGSAFYDKGQHAIAEAILRRAVESLGATDDEQIGLIYWLGRAQEAQGKVDPAITTYERVLAVDIKFMDAGTRMAKLSKGRAR